MALEAIYAAFSHGWAEAFSDDPRGRNLAEEAIWLGRVVVSLAPNEPEAMGLMALMLYAHARREARRDAEGRYVPLSEQDTGVVGPGGDRGGGGAAAVRGRLGRAGTLPARGGRPIGPRRPPADRNDRLGGDRRPLRRALRPDRLLRSSPSIARRRSPMRGGPRRGSNCSTRSERKAGSTDSSPIGSREPTFAPRLGEVEEARRAYGLAIGLQTDPAARAFLIERLAALV